MLPSVSARRLTRILTNLVAIAAVCAIFAAKAVDAGVDADAPTTARVAIAPSH